MRCADHWMKMWNLATAPMKPEELVVINSPYQKLSIEQHIQYLMERAGAMMFVVGNAEKVAIGACRAAMSAPHKKDIHWFRPLHVAVGEEYGLLRHEIARSNRVECWLVRDAAAHALLRRGINDNVTRAYLCGIEAGQIDSDYILEAPAVVDDAGVTP